METHTYMVNVLGGSSIPKTIVSKRVGLLKSCRTRLEADPRERRPKTA